MSDNLARIVGASVEGTSALECRQCMGKDWHGYDQIVTVRDVLAGTTRVAVSLPDTCDRCGGTVTA